MTGGFLILFPQGIVGFRGKIYFTKSRLRLMKAVSSSPVSIF